MHKFDKLTAAINLDRCYAQNVVVMATNDVAKDGNVRFVRDHTSRLDLPVVADIPFLRPQRVTPAVVGWTIEVETMPEVISAILLRMALIGARLGTRNRSGVSLRARMSGHWISVGLPFGRDAIRGVVPVGVLDLWEHLGLTTSKEWETMTFPF